MAQLLFDLTSESETPDGDETALDKFILEQRELLYTEFPHVKKQATGDAPKRVYRPLQDLTDEARTVIKLSSEAPTMPQDLGEVYHVISMDWYQQWKQYTGYERIANEVTPDGLRHIETTASETSAKEELPPGSK